MEEAGFKPKDETYGEIIRIIGRPICMQRAVELPRKRHVRRTLLSVVGAM